MLLRLVYRAAIAAVVCSALWLPAGSSWAQHGHGGHGGGHFGGGHFGGHHGGGHHGGGHYGGGHFGGGHYGGGHHGGVGIHVGGHHGGVGIHLGGHHDIGHDYGDHHWGGHYFSYGHHDLYDHHVPIYFGFYAGPWYGWYDDPHYHFYSPTIIVDRQVQVGKVVVDDGQSAAQAPEQTPDSAQGQGDARPSAEGLRYKRRGEDAFRAGNYRQSLRYFNHAIVELPRDGRLYLLTAQALFAVGEYRSAAAAIHQGVSLLDADDWGSVVQNYQDYYRGDAYVRQMRRLDEYIDKNPEAAYAYFVRGYQYGFLGHKEAAVADLAKAWELEKRDELAARLVERFGGKLPRQSGSQPDTSAPVLPTPPQSASGSRQSFSDAQAGHDHSSGQSDGHHHGADGHDH